MIFCNLKKVSFSYNLCRFVLKLMKMNKKRNLIDKESKFILTKNLI
jgi:hypothetical protein